MSTVRATAAAASSRARWSPECVVLAALGACLGLSPFADGLYSSTVWVPAGLGVLVVLTAVLVAGPSAPSRGAIGGPLALAALAALSLVSALWAESIEQAVVEGNRLLVYAAAWTLVVILLRSERGAVLAFAAFAFAALVVAGWVLSGMLRGDETLFFRSRLHEPLGYVNGQASFFLLAFWPCLALAERRDGDAPGFGWRAAVPAGLGLAGATLFAGLAVLGQSRGVVIAAALSLGIVLALLPGRLRRIVALLVAAACLAPATPALLDVYRDAASDAAAFSAAVALLLASAAAGAGWALLVVLERRRRADRLRLRRLVTIGVTVMAVLAAAVAVGSADRIARFADRQYTAFVALDKAQDGATASRLASGAGNRYDYWRVAAAVWRDHPLAGTGAGGYDTSYFARRATIEDVRQPHSLPLQVLAELGIAGALLLMAVALVVAIAARRRIRSGAREPVVVAALGVLAAWSLHTSVDWVHLLPGVAGVAMLAAAVLTRPTAGVAAARHPIGRAGPAAAFVGVRSRVVRIASASVIGIAIAIAALSLSRQGLTERHVHRAQDAVAADPAQTVVEANRALRLDREAVAAYYAKAAALARLGEGEAARQVLLDAARREPRNFVTWVLLGDLSVRRGTLHEARNAYGRALRLNPRQPGLAKLAADVQAAERRAGGG
jgi:tetratricopeptide (TPR) repeat protein